MAADKAEKDAKMQVDGETKKDTAVEKPPPPPPTPSAEIKSNIQLIERAVSTLEPRFTARVLRSLTTLRKKLNGTILTEAVNAAYSKDGPAKQALLSFVPASKDVPASMEVDNAPAPPAKGPAAQAEPCPEVDIYLRLLILLHLMDTPGDAASNKACELAQETITKIQSLNRRSLDAIAARVYFYFGRVHELKKDADTIRPILLAAQRTASLRRDDELQATLINLLLRNYLQHNLYQQADHLISKTTFPSTTTGNTQLSRYLYYLGRIRAVQLSYTEAHTHLQQAIRRAPSAQLAPGFYQTVHKLFLIVELLMGDIPERSLFRHPVLKKALGPYLKIVQAVRTGDLSSFQSSLTQHRVQFQQDQTYTLILRLRHNVIKTGVRALSIAYSRISLRDICLKLHLDSEEDAEYIVGKAVRDGVIDARVDHAKGWMESWRRGDAGSGGKIGGVDVYETGEPREAFAKRIGFCLDLHNESVKAMRYPLNMHRKDLATAAEAREREKELAMEIVDGEHDDDDDPVGDF
ncbi:26S proteasome non-ATPase regulatory subunit [Tulasnella sp. JGI-2019a]|nr:26S proteasome non-ATPase regulatory subunit [Tulasnella sp. JGI-2019a]